MVVIRRPFGGQRIGRMRPAAVTAMLLGLATMYNFGGDTSLYGSVAITTGLIESRNATIAPSRHSQGAMMRTWRNELRSTCSAFVDTIQENITEVHLQRKEELEATALKRLTVPDPNTIRAQRQQQPYKFCKHVLIDLGTNRGDTVAAAVDASLDVCSPVFMEADRTIKKAYRISKKFPHPHFDANDLRLHSKGFKAFGLATRLQKFFDGIMDETCVYGMEGNPHFTGHLQKLETIVNAMSPRPLKHLNIDTETVVSPVDGPTTLYVDRVSVKDHFWGSSLIKSMPDVRKSAEQNNGTAIEAEVRGMKLSTLLRRTLAAFDPNGEPTSKIGGSVLIKMDIEGAEYSIIKELAASNTLCDYVGRHQNNATVIVEYHQRLFRDAAEKLNAMDGVKEAREKLKNCGVVFQQLPNFFTG